MLRFLQSYFPDTFVNLQTPSDAEGESSGKEGVKIGSKYQKILGRIKIPKKFWTRTGSPKRIF